MLKNPKHTFIDTVENLGDLRDIRKLLGSDFFKTFSASGTSSNPFFDEEDDDEYPVIDMYDLGSEICIWAEIPGLKRTDMSLEVSSYSLLIQGQIPAPTGKRDHQVLLSERFYGPFKREVELPVRIRSESVQASYANGLLVVTLAKFSFSEEEAIRSVDIDFGQ